MQKWGTNLKVTIIMNGKPRITQVLINSPLNFKAMKIIAYLRSFFLNRIKPGGQRLLLIETTEIVKPEIPRARDKKWIMVGCSVIGNSHIANNIPCQDAHNVGDLSDKWCFAIVSDGAGSHENSHYGSAFMVKNLEEVLQSLVAYENWYHLGVLPTPKEWRDIAITAFSFVYDNLMQYGKQNNMPMKSLGGTLNMLLISEYGYMSAHIGDGRTAIQHEDGEWTAAIKPFKGEVAGETVFLTTDYTWQHPELCIETRVIPKPVKSFALLSDGLEYYCFYCNMKREDIEMYFDPNKPYEKFFDTNIDVIKSMYNSGTEEIEIREKFCHYLKEGHPQISLETDDKTIVLGIKL